MLSPPQAKLLDIFLSPPFCCKNKSSLQFPFGCYAHAVTNTPQLSVRMSASTFPSFLEPPITSPLARRSHSTLSHHIPSQISNEVQRMFKRRFLALRPPTNSLHAHLRRRAPWPQMPAMLVIPTCHLYFQVISTPWESRGKTLHGSESDESVHKSVQLD